MKIILAQHFGLCFGVRDAITEAHRLAALGPLTILGELVHNPLVRAELRERGVQEGDLTDPGSAPTPQVMITAHGASDTARTAWRAAGFDVADGTCPLVRLAHTKLQALVKAGFFPVIIGQAGHVEVEGLRGDFPEAVVVANEPDFARVPERGKVGVISQTTQPLARVRELVAALQRERPECEVRFVDTVCQPTKDRQAALQALLAEADTVVVVGGKRSNNTLQLAAAAEAAGRAVHHVEAPAELQPAWFDESRVVGVTAGTSTLKETVSAVAARLREFAAEAELRALQAPGLSSAAR